MEEITNQFQKVTQGRIPAEETLRRLAECDKKFTSFEITMNDIQNNIKNICEQLKDNKDEHKQILAKMDEFIKGCDNKYASKKVEVILFWIGGLIGAGVIGAILKTILVD
jgi:hypothetical protein